MMTMTMTEMIEMECIISFWFIRPLKLRHIYNTNCCCLGGTFNHVYRVRFHIVSFTGKTGDHREHGTSVVHPCGL